MPKSISKLKKECWKLLSQVVRKEKPFCELCGRLTAHAHHIIPRARGNCVYFLERNIASLCASCHMSWHRRMSPGEIEEAVVQMRGDFRDVENVKWDMKKISRTDYYYMIRAFKERL